MPLILADRVLELSTTTGTGSFTLAGSIVGFQTFNSAIGNGNTTYYTIECPTTGDWETGLGTFTSPSTLARTTVYSSSNSGSLVNFGAGTKNVFVDMSATKWTNGKLVVANGGTGASTSDGASENLSTTYTVDNLTALKALTTRPSSVFMKGYATTGDGGEGLWEWVAGSSATANDGTIVQCTSGTAGRYFRVVGDTIRPEWFGAKGDGTTNDSTAVLAAVNACNNQSILLNPTKAGYPFSVTVGSSSGCTGFLSVGGKARVVNPPGSTGSTLIIYSQRGNFTVDNLFFDLPISTDPAVGPLTNCALRCDLSGQSYVRFTNNHVSGGKTPVFFSNNGAVDAYVTGNKLEEFWGDGITVITEANVEITDNILKNGAYSSTASSGAIRTSSYTGSTAKNIIISRNIISNCNVTAQQSSIDCYSNGAKNIIISENICDLNGAGIELKTDGTGGASGVYRSISVVDNLVRLLPGAVGVQAIALNISGGYTIADGWASGVLIANNQLFCDTMPVTDTSTYGISGNCYANVTISGNMIYNLTRGINVSPNGTTSATMDRFEVVGNTINTSLYGIYNVTAGTINNLRIIGNEITSALPILYTTATCNSPSITGNTLISASSYALRFGEFTGGVVSNNNISGYTYGIYASGSTNSGVLVTGNTIATNAASGNDAVTVDAGSSISLLGNQIRVPTTRRAYSGAGTVTSADNVRGTATATPTVAGSIGDVYLNSAPSAGGAKSWVCTTAGASGAAVYTASLLSPGSISVGSTAISGGTSGRVLYDNGGLVGELVTGTPGKTLTSKSATPTVATWDYLQSTEDYQVIIGTNAMTNPTPGSARFNIAIGTEALRDATTADSTVAIGYHAGADMAVGRAGVFIGYAAGEHVGGGSSNTFLGGFSGRGTASNPLTGVDNTMVGEAAGLHIQGNSNFNVGVGFNALYGLTEASSNTALGTAAGLCLTTTAGNTLVGSTAYEFGNGSSNVVVGQNAGHGLTLYAYTANSVTPAGGTTLYFSDTSNITVGSVLYIGDTLVVGTKATAVNPNVSVDIDIPTIKSVPINTFVTIMPNQHIGSNNVYVGYLAGYSAQGAIDDITAVGYGSMRYTQTGLRNTAVGSWTLGSTSSTTMNDCTVVGYRAGWYAAGDSNTSIGSQALRASQTNPLTGTSNTAVGASAMFNIAGAAASNTAVGSSAATNITTGSSNTLVGSSTASTLTTGSSNILIGASVNVPSASTSNYLNVGNAIYGTGILGGTVQIGINKSAPTATLHVGGDLVVDATARLNSYVGLNAAPNTRFAIYNLTSLTGGTTAYGIYNSQSVESDVTGALYSYSSAPATKADIFTLTSAYHFIANNMTIGAGSSLNNQYGFYAGNFTSGAASNYAFYGGVSANTGSYNLYMGGSALNYLAGNLGIGGAPVTQYGLRYNGKLTGSTIGIGAYFTPVFQSDITSNGTVFRSTPATEAAAFTLTTLTHYYATAPTIGSGSSITAQYGFYADAGLNGATNNYGFYTNLASATGVWAFYGSGTAASYFGGAVTVVGALTYGGVTLSNSVNGTGSMVLSNNPTLTGGGTITANNPALTITQTWNNAAVAFTGALINITPTASASNSLLLDVQNTGSPRFSVNAGGNTVQTGQATIGNTSAFLWNGRSQAKSSADGYIELFNNAATGFTGLRLGGTSASFPMIKVNGANIDFRFADDSAYNAITVNAINVISTGNASINWPSRSRISSATDGYVTFMNASASGFTGLQLGGTSASFPMVTNEGGTVLGVRAADNSGWASVNAGAYVIRGGGTFGTASASTLSLATDSYALLRNNAATDFTGLRLGGTTSSFPMLKKNSTSLETKLADDSAYSNHSALSFTSTGSTWANIPAAGNAGRMQFVSNAGTKGSMWLDDGTRWKPLNGSVVLATLDTASASIGNAETVVFQYLIPAGVLQTNDRLRLFVNYAKSGTTDTGGIRFRLGTAGTVADTLIFGGSNYASAAQRFVASIYDFRLASATSLQGLEPTAIYGYSGGSATAFPAAAAISSASANSLYLSVSVFSGGATDTVQLVDGQIQLISSAN